ncbi:MULTISPECIES: hypothetical protein [Calothrix]|uniref:Uncharacterized protein n=2 Tax=Calothrix TaxID=1186 RepID=A0ABR8ABZ1_9CYAN|nr:MULTISPECIES: hypothetical protein [Calothrix]MBD2196975.1 hypothetical protein [Calothrix parietina FACHB-288]MBD2225527.1 hypothetical protein [Calothrix anomala FACHB-343]
MTTDTQSEINLSFGIYAIEHQASFVLIIDESKLRTPILNFLERYIE